MQDKILVWDLPLRIFHWLLVIAFTVAYASEDKWLTVHVWAGYLIMALLVFRFIWGFTGGHYARFKQFLCKPAKSIRYLKEVNALTAKRYIGHNPAGALMIVLMLTSLLLTCLSGLAVYAADQSAGPFAEFIGANYEKIWEEIHEFFVNFTLFLVIIHLVAILFDSYVFNENITKSMWNGYKNKTDNDIS